MIKIADLNKKLLLIGFAVFSSVYFTLDHLNLSYSKMADQFGIWLVLLNILLNLVMAGISAFMLVLSDHVLKEKNIKTRGDNMGILSIIVGILTYGCTPCVISFLAVFGISFSVMALPFAGLPYKLLSLALLILGVFILKKELERKSCKISFRTESNNTPNSWKV